MSAWLALLDAPTGDLSAAVFGGGHRRVLAAWLDSDARPHPRPGGRQGTPCREVAT
jgi:hypothetical protein